MARVSKNAVEGAPTQKAILVLFALLWSDKAKSSKGTGDMVTISLLNPLSYPSDQYLISPEIVRLQLQFMSIQKLIIKVRFSG